MAINSYFSVRSWSFIRFCDGYHITCVTDIPCHLTMRWSLVEPQIHDIPKYIRGIFLHGDRYFCFVAYEDNEQLEAGDTLTHTFVKLGWPFCQTRWFYFWGTVSGFPTHSTTCIFKLHRDHKCIERLIASGTDDCQRGKFIGADYFGTIFGYNAAGHWDWQYTHLGCGMRFLDLDIPKNSQILSSNIRFRCHTIDGRAGVRTKLRGHYDGYSQTFSTIADFDSRIRTSASIAWDSIEPWIPPNYYYSLDITPIVQEIMSHPGWYQGHPITIFWDDFEGRSGPATTGSRWAQSFDSIPFMSPLLTVLYKEA